MSICPKCGLVLMRGHECSYTRRYRAYSLGYLQGITGSSQVVYREYFMDELTAHRTETRLEKSLDVALSCDSIVLQAGEPAFNER